MSDALSDSTDAATSRWSITNAVTGVVIAVMSALFVITLIGAIYVASGVDRPQDDSSFEFIAIAAQDLVFVTVALLMTGGLQGWRPSRFGFRSFRPTAVGWAALAFTTYIVFSAVYAAILHPSSDNLLEKLGANEGTVLAIISGIFVIAVAPPVEELFFRGFVYQSFRNRLGVWGGAAGSGLIFGAIHLEPAFLVPLAMLGFLLALLFEKTGSLWPCILVHAVNNAIVFAVSL